MTLRLGSLCTGYGGLDLAAEAVLGPMEHAWYAEHDPAVTPAGNPVPQHAAQVAAAHWPDVPNLGDLTAIDWTTLPRVDVLTAGFPCTDVSPAGKRAGLKPGTRTGIWSHIAHGIGVLRPRLVLLENVEGLLSGRAHSDVEPCPWCLGDTDPELVVRALGAVLADLAELGFDAEWTTVAASDVGAPHRRRRVFIVAWPSDCPPDAGMLAGRVGVGGAAADGVTLLPTPTRADGERRSTTYARGNPTPTGALLPTPNAALGRGTGTPSAATAADRYAQGKRFLDDAVALLPTPAARDWKSGESNIMDRNARPLNEVIVNLLPTPTVADSRSSRNATAGRTAIKPTTSLGWTLSDVAHADRWGQYAPAIARWEVVTGRPAPDPTEPGTKGQPRLSAAFVEWVMGLPAGWVTDHVPRNGALKCLGNGVVWQQATHAYAELIAAITPSTLVA
ncbi:DNA cytosine methyltransferase [Micromonospora rubida]